jgi:hypothetical protein
MNVYDMVYDGIALLIFTQPLVNSLLLELWLSTHPRSLKSPKWLFTWRLECWRARCAPWEPKTEMTKMR